MSWIDLFGFPITLSLGLGTFKDGIFHDDSLYITTDCGY